MDDHRRDIWIIGCFTALMVAAWLLVGLAIGTLSVESILLFGPFVGPFAIWLLIRLLNSRDDRSLAKRPPDPP